MQRAKRNLFILLAVLLVLAALLAVYLIASSAKARRDAEEAENSIIRIGGLGTVSAVSFNPAGGDETRSFILKDGVWYLDTDPTAPVKQTILSRIAEDLENYTAVSDMEMSDSPAAYGLSDPVYTVSASDTEGKSMTLFIGNSFGSDGNYYAMEPGGDRVLIIAKKLPEDMDYDLYSMYTLDTYASVSEDAMTSLAVSYGGKSVSFEKSGEDWYLLRGGQRFADTEYTVAGSDGEEHTARYYLNGVRSGAANSFFSGCNGYNCADSELKEYGLIQPLVLTVGYTDGGAEAELTLYIGARFEYSSTDFYYAKLPDSAEVCRITADRAEAFYEAVAALGE